MCDIKCEKECNKVCNDQEDQTEEENVRMEINKKIKEIDNVENKFKTIALNHHLEKKKALDSLLEKEMKSLTLKYDLLSKPIYQDSQDIISGARGVTEEEVKDSYLLTEAEKATLGEQLVNKTQIKGYWLACMKNCDMLAPEIKEKDEDVLEHLEKIEYTPDQENPLKFELVFTFSANEWFENTTLSKTFELKDDDEPLKGSGSEIQWKEGKNITVKTVKKTQKNKKSGAKRVVTKEVEDESFFNFFKDSEAGEDVDEEDEEAMNAEEKLNVDFDIARGFVDEIIPYSLEYYLGVKTADGEDYEGMDGQDDDYSDEDAEEEEKPKKNKKKAHKKSSDSGKSDGDQKGGKAGEKPECKQQ